MTKDKKAHPERMQTKKYCKFCKKHTMHKETKQSDRKGENVMSEKTQKKSWFKGVKSEFKKITWPDKKSLFKQTLAVILVSLVLGVIIAALDSVLQLGISALLSI